MKLLPVLLCSSLLAACSAPGTPRPELPLEALEPEPEAPARILFEDSGVMVLRLDARSFRDLPLKDRILAWHLHEAALVGRDIAFDQSHRHALAIRDLLTAILAHPRGVPEEGLAKFRAYARLFWLNNGPYRARTRDRFPTPFTRAELVDALAVARGNGAELRDAGEILEAVSPFLFNVEMEPLATCRNPAPGGDLLLDSGNNLHHGVSMADLEGFEERHPLNSRLVKGASGLVEEVFRAGRPLGDGWEIPPGRHAPLLDAVCTHLISAAQVAEGDQRDYLLALAEHYRTGDPAGFDTASIAWLRSEPEVDLIHGFIETYLDARGAKGEYEGLVMYRDPRGSRLLQVIAENAQALEDRAPWKPRYRKTWDRAPVAAAVNVLVAVGHAGPGVPLGINLPNSQAIRQEHGSKSVLLANVMAGIRAALSDRALEEFVPPEERDLERRYRRVAGDAMVALHEIVGHGSGRVAEGLKGDPATYLLETYSTLEETRAELVALHHIFDPVLVEQGVLPHPRAAEAALRGYLRQDLLQLRRVEAGDRFTDDHMRATHLIAQYLARECGCVELRLVGGEHFPIITDLGKARAAVAALLAEVMRIKAEGDVAAARALVDGYGTRFDPALRDEVVRRAREAGIPRYFAFHMPTLVAIRDEEGDIVDVLLDEVEDFDSMMLRWDLEGLALRRGSAAP